MDFLGKQNKKNYVISTEVEGECFGPVKLEIYYWPFFHAILLVLFNNIIRVRISMVFSILCTLNWQKIGKTDLSAGFI